MGGRSPGIVLSATSAKTDGEGTTQPQAASPRTRPKRPIYHGGFEKGDVAQYPFKYEMEMRTALALVWELRPDAVLLDPRTGKLRSRK
jgi:hypothetical protein